MEITHREIEEFSQQLEVLLPTQIDGIEMESDLMVRFAYRSGTLKLEYLEGSDDPLTPYHCGWTYIVQQNRVCGDSFEPMMSHTGFVDIPISRNGSLLTTDIDFLKALAPQTEIYT